jgi:hypothetical protein
MSEWPLKHGVFDTIKGVRGMHSEGAHQKETGD